MQNSRKELFVIIGLIVLAAILGYIYVNQQNSVTSSSQVSNSPTTPKTSSTVPYTEYETTTRYNQKEDLEPMENGTEFVFVQDQKVLINDVYSGGDFPSKREFMLFTKGDIIQGVYEPKSCGGSGCTPVFQHVSVKIQGKIRTLELSYLALNK